MLPQFISRIIRETFELNNPLGAFLSLRGLVFGFFCVVFFVGFGLFFFLIPKKQYQKEAKGKEG